MTLASGAWNKAGPLGGVTDAMFGSSMSFAIFFLPFCFLCGGKQLLLVYYISM
jgi:hypothetical protein